MRLLLDIEANSDMKYTHKYKYNLHGKIWNSLEGTEFEKYHDMHIPCFSFSNIFPFENILTEGQSYSLLISSPFSNFGRILYENFNTGDLLNLGDLSFTISDVRSVSVDAGTVGTSGVISTETGVFFNMTDSDVEKFDLTVPEYSDEYTSWVPKFGLESLNSKIADNVSRKQGTVCGEFLEEPKSGEMFDAVTIRDTYGVQIPVSSEYERTFVVTKFDFEYTVRSADHRRWLNLLLSNGVGEQNSYGFGFANITHKNGEKL